MKILFFITGLFSLTLGAVNAPTEVQPLLEKIAEVEEGALLLKKHADIQVRFIPKQQFDAYWVAGARTICLSETNRSRPERLLRSLIFELHNAESTAKLQALHSLARARRISRNEYIKQCEKIEFLNSLATMDILEKGIRSGRFPHASRWLMPRTFDDYFRVQLQSGHASYHGSNYDRLS
ncbi:MAG: hypothetical protein KDK48_00580 [Chlamydiia bacterium]|nr:hypothetical protein [Chlamydiia bacterium]